MAAIAATLLMLCAVWVTLAVRPAAAQQSGGDLLWTVQEASGDVRFRVAAVPPAPWQSLKSGHALGANAEIEAGASGRAVLAHEGSRVTIAPNSQLTLPDHVPAGAVYRVVQRVGTILFKIVHTSKDKFQVETPYLTTAIKGTTFSVSVNNGGGAVHVTEGAVFVRPLSGEGTMVTPGQTARVPAGANRGVIINGRVNNQSGVKGTASATAAVDRNDGKGRGQTAAEATSGNKPRVVAIVFETAKGKAGSDLNKVSSNALGAPTGDKGKGASGNSGGGNSGSGSGSSSSGLSSSGAGGNSGASASVANDGGNASVGGGGNGSVGGASGIGGGASGAASIGGGSGGGGASLGGGSGSSGGGGASLGGGGGISGGAGASLGGSSGIGGGSGSGIGGASLGDLSGNSGAGGKGGGKKG